MKTNNFYLLISIITALPFTILIGWIDRHFDWRWLVSALLVIYVGGAAGDVLLGIFPLMMVMGLTAVLDENG